MALSETEELHYRWEGLVAATADLASRSVAQTRRGHHLDLLLRVGGGDGGPRWEWFCACGERGQVTGRACDAAWEWSAHVADRAADDVAQLIIAALAPDLSDALAASGFLDPHEEG